MKAKDEKEKSSEVEPVAPDLRIFVRGPKMSHADYLEYFSDFGVIEKVILNKSHAVIQFNNSESLESIMKVDRHEFNGKMLTVEPYLQKEALLKLKTGKKQPLVDVQPMQKNDDDNDMYNSIKNNLQTADDASEQVKQITRLRLSDRDIENREKVRIYLQKLFDRYFIYSKLSVFGSTFNRLGLVKCDIDILLSFRTEKEDEKEHSHPKYTDKRQFKLLKDVIINKRRKIRGEEFSKVRAFDVNDLLMLMLKSDKMCKNIVSIPAKSCPILNFEFEEENEIYRCDLSAINRLAIWNSELIKLYTLLDPRVLPFMIFTRVWMNQVKMKLNNVVKITSYANSLLCIFYLQNRSPPLLPTINLLKSYDDQTRTVATIDCSFCMNVEKIPRNSNNETLEELVKHFFGFYAKNDFKNVVLSIASGKSIPIDELLENFPNFRNNFVNLQDAFDYTRNVTFNVDSSLHDHLAASIKCADCICQVDELWIPQENETWGIMLLLDVSANENWRNLSLPVEKNSQKRKRDLLRKIEMLQPSEFEQLRNFVPVTQSSEFLANDEICFAYICEIIIALFENGLKFKVLKESTTIKNDDTTAEPRNCAKSREAEDSDEERPAKLRKPNENETVADDTNEDEWLLQTPWRVVEVRVNTWSTRDSFRLVEISGQQSILKRESEISYKITGHDVTEDSPTLLEFSYRLQVASSQTSYILIKHESGEQSMVTQLFTFLDTFIPDCLRDMINLGNFT